AHMSGQHEEDERDSPDRWNASTRHQSQHVAGSLGPAKERAAIHADFEQPAWRHARGTHMLSAAAEGWSEESDANGADWARRDHPRGKRPAGEGKRMRSQSSNEIASNSFTATDTNSTSPTPLVHGHKGQGKGHLSPLSRRPQLGRQGHSLDSAQPRVLLEPLPREVAPPVECTMVTFNFGGPTEPVKYSTAPSSSGRLPAVSGRMKLKNSANNTPFGALRAEDSAPSLTAMDNGHHDEPSTTHAMLTDV
ncbi:hypothetical protein CYMTET_10772, partial [Cymbomonas tetramitiformis]